MRNCILMTLLLWCSLSYAQTIFSHEKRIDNREDYQFREINFFNGKDRILLSGTLITPKSGYDKVLIIIPGSGKDTRNSHFKLTKELLKNNIAVYRFDERGVGKSEGKYTTSIDGLSLDILYALKHLKSVDDLKGKEIGALGHSLGGMATIVAQQYYKQNSFDFLIQIASPVKSYAEASKYQITTLPTYKIPNKSKEETISLFNDLLTIVRKNPNKSITRVQEQGYQLIKQKGFNTNDVKFWSYTHIDLYKQDYEKAYELLQIPTMYVIGSQDKYVNPQQEAKHLLQLHNPQITVKVMNHLNHYLTRGVLNTHDLYNMDKSATQAIINWIEKI